MSRIPPTLPPRPYGQSKTSFVQHPTVSESSCYNIFHYKKLEEDEFRLLLLLNRTGSRSYKLLNTNLYKAPPYLALSYSWGKEKSDAEITINEEKFKLRMKSLEVALGYLINRYPGQHLWTDAICINQDDAVEKASQICRMKEIYTKTEKCVIWLGECSRPVDRALSQLPVTLQRLQRYPPRLGINEASFRRYGIPATTSDEWKGLAELMTNEWFTRVWTFQESVLPKTLEILCGNHVISVDHLGQLAGIITAMPESGGLEFMGDRIYGILGLLEDPGLEKHLEPYMNVKEPNELFLIFAKYWIQQDKHYQLFHFVPSNHFVSDWDGPQCQSTNSEDNLNDKQFRGRRLPSWCPSPLDSGNATSFWYSGLAAKYTAGIQPGRSRGRIRLVPGKEDAIQMEGFAVDKIRTVDKCPWNRQTYGNDRNAKAAGARETVDWGRRCLQISLSIYNRGNPSPQFFRQRQQANPFMKAAEDITRLLPPGNPALRAAQGLAGKFFKAVANASATRTSVGVGTGQDEIPDAHWQTLIANKDGNGNFYTGDGREASRLALLAIDYLAQPDLPRPQLSTRQQALLQDYLQAFGFGAHGRAFVSTEGGRIGLAPQHALPGDKVVILWNAGSPYVLRPVGDESFKLVGEAYVHGLMYGEALPGRQGISDEWFILE